METEEVTLSSVLRKGLLLLQPFVTVMGTFRVLFLFSQLLSSFSCLSTDIRLVSASLLVGTDLAGEISSARGSCIIQNISEL